METNSIKIGNLIGKERRMCWEKSVLDDGMAWRPGMDLPEKEPLDQSFEWERRRKLPAEFIPVQIRPHLPVI